MNTQPNEVTGKLQRGWRPLRNCGMACALLAVLCAASPGVAPAGSPEGKWPQARWIFTTNSHFTWYGLLALAPIYRGDIRSALLAPTRVYLAVQDTADVIQFVALDRRSGQVVWETRLTFDGYPVANRMVQVGERLIAALYDDRMKGIVVLGMNPADGTTVWRTSLPRYDHLDVFGDLLEAGYEASTVILYVPGSKQRNRVVLRASDGGLISERSYNGYFWPAGAREAAGLLFAFDGEPRWIPEHDRFLAFREGTSQLLWTLPLSRRRTSLPALAGDSLFISRDTQLLRIHTATGQAQWTASLGGRIPVTAEAPVVIDSRVAVINAASPDPEENRWRLSIHRLTDGVREAEMAWEFGGESGSPSELRRVGDLVVMASYSALQVVDPVGARTLAAHDFKGDVSRFVYSEASAVKIADSDSQGLIAVMADGKVRYYAAEDFHRQTSKNAPGAPRAAEVK